MHLKQRPQTNSFETPPFFVGVGSPTHQWLGFFFPDHNDKATIVHEDSRGSGEEGIQRLRIRKNPREKFGLSPLPVIVEMKVYWDSLLKM